MKSSTIFLSGLVIGFMVGINLGYESARIETLERNKKEVPT